MGGFHGSSDAAVEGRHYRNMRINKEMFCALVQHRVEELTNDYNDIHIELKSLFWNLKSDSYLTKLFIFICFNDSPSKMMKNAFYFTLKPLFFFSRYLNSCLDFLGM